MRRIGSKRDCVMPEVEENMCPETIEGGVWMGATWNAEIIALDETEETVVNQKLHFRDQPAGSKYGLVVKVE